MSIARRIGVVLALAASVAIPSVATSQRATSGYSYRFRVTGRTTEPNGGTTDYVVMSGRALVTEKAGRLDIDESSPKRGTIAAKDDYVLYDSTSMTIVVPRDRQLVRFSLATLEHDLAGGASIPGTFVQIANVAVNVEPLDAGEPKLGMATTKFRITQDYTVAATRGLVRRNSTEHIVQDLLTTEQQGLANPFARLIRSGPGSGYSEIVTKMADARRRMGRGIPLETVTTTTSTSSRNEVTKTVTTMTVTDLHAENIDDDILVAPTDYQAVPVSALAKASSNSQGAQAGAPAKAARPAGTGDAAASAKGDFVKTLHGMGRRP